MNLFTTIPPTWKPNDIEAINEWFEKIHGTKQKVSPEYQKFLFELKNVMQN